MSRIVYSFLVGVTAALVACTSSPSSPDSTTSTADRVLLQNAQVSADEKPVFVDADGQLDSIFRAKGYVYGVDIVESAAGGSADARYILAQMYAYGIAGARPDASRAFSLYLGLADEGMPEAQAVAGHMLFFGLGTETNEEEGIKLLSKSVEQNCALGCLFLGNFYANNAPATEENKANAKLLYAKAAALGISDAQTLLDNLK